MPSSTSSSEAARETPRPAQVFFGRLIRQLLWVAVGVLLAMELITRMGYSHISNIERRIATEHGALGSIQSEPGRRSALLVGNSLLLFGVDMPLLKTLVAPQMEPYRYAIESTMLLDWQYGIRRVFADGARPDAIVLVMGPTQLSTPEIRGDYSAYYLFRTADIPSVARAARYDRTKEGSLFFGRYSLFLPGAITFVTLC